MTFSIRKDVQVDLLGGVLNGVGAVADVAANSEGKVTTDGSCARSFQDQNHIYLGLLVMKTYQVRSQEGW